MAKFLCYFRDRFGDCKDGQVEVPDGLRPYILECPSCHRKASYLNAGFPGGKGKK